MKYGVLYNKNNVNIGDDIQAYATARFLPKIDYFIDREHIDDFKPETEEPVAVIMNAWYMWAKWNWPPSKYILPKMIGFHYADHQLAKQPGSPVKYEFLEGLGGEYLKTYGPVGCRDYFTRDKLSQIGIDSYFSGCITMTLPKMPERENKGKYICLVDLEKKVRDKLLPSLLSQGIEVKVITHNRERDSEMGWEDRCEMVKEILTVYQNARCVVTKRLHCSLPCLAMDVPVFIIKEMEDDIRFDPYYDFFYRTTVTRFMNDDYEYDFLNPPPNKGFHKPFRDELIKVCEEFVNEVKDENRSIKELIKTNYTEDELRKWRHDTMKNAMNNWLQFSREFQVENKKLRKKEAREAKEIASLKKKLTAEKEKVKRLKDDKKTLQEAKRELAKKSKALEKEKQKMLNASSWSIVKYIFKRKFKPDTIDK